MKKAIVVASFGCSIKDLRERYDILDKLKEKEYTKVYLYPFLIVSGDHALNDIGSDDEESIKSKIINNGFDVNMFFAGLGENESAVNVFVNRLNEILTV